LLANFCQSVAALVTGGLKTISPSAFTNLCIFQYNQLNLMSSDKNIEIQTLSHAHISLRAAGQILRATKLW